MDTLIQKSFYYLTKISDFWGDVTDISAEALIAISARVLRMPYSKSLAVMAVNIYDINDT